MAQFNLAIMLERGEGGDEDPDEARRLLRLAANAGQAEATKLLDELATSAANDLLAQDEAEKRAKSSAAAAKRAKKKRSKRSNNASPPSPIDEASVSTVASDLAGVGLEGGGEEEEAPVRSAEHVSLAEVGDVTAALHIGRKSPPPPESTLGGETT